MEEARRDPRPDSYTTPGRHFNVPWAEVDGGTQTFEQRRERRDFEGLRVRREALRLLGPVVYAARVPGGQIKIGHSADIVARLRGLKAVELLAVAPGTLDDEQALHARLVDHVHHGREWYYPTPGVLAVVNEMRDTLGLEPLAA